MSEVVEAPRRRAAPAPGRLADAGLVAGLLVLTFLLGAFPLDDPDFWWHLKAGDLIRQTGRVPRVDTYTFGAEGHRWVDLHWVFQVLLSLGHERVGIPGLNLAKCAITALAVGLLVAAKKGGWPTWVVVLAWLPALLVMAERMVLRPEVLTLLYFAAFLAILLRWDDRPWLAYLLPVVQLAWVNSHGLFPLGPIALAFALIDAAVRRPAPPRRWWAIVLPVSALTGLACLANPYGLAGALFPLQLLRTMWNPLIEAGISEFEAPLHYARRVGFWNASTEVHLAALAVGVLSFLVPAITRRGGPGGRGRPSTFRLLLFAAFAALSLKARRNGHQFAAVAGAVSTWNLAEWAAEVARARASRGAPGRPWIGRAAAFAALAGAFVALGSGRLLAWQSIGRTLGLGEKPYNYPHEAVARAGLPGMPRRSVCFYLGHSALYEYAHAPERKTYVDGRLEVVGPGPIASYFDLELAIAADAPGWEGRLEGMGRPLVLTDNGRMPGPGADLTASLLASARYRCVWFDPIAAVFVHESDAAARSHAFDFAAEHFRRGDGAGATDAAAERMLARACGSVLHRLLRLRPEARPRARGLVQPLVWAGLDHARAVQRLGPGWADGWRWAGIVEAARTPSGGEPTARFRMAFDPTLDLAPARASADLVRSLAMAPADPTALVALIRLDARRGMYARAVESIGRLLALRPRLPFDREMQDLARALLPGLTERLGAPPGPSRPTDPVELRRLLDDLYDHGRAADAAQVLESAYPPDIRPWEVWDRFATIRLHLGEPERAERLWSEAKGAPSPPVRLARIAAARLAGGDFAGARAAYREAIGSDPKLFEALYGLAVLESDDGRAREALAAARAAAEAAPDGPARGAAERLAEAVAPYSGRPEADGRPDDLPRAGR